MFAQTSEELNSFANLKQSYHIMQYLFCNTHAALSTTASRIPLTQHSKSGNEH
jgi:hypothetical protein